MKSPDARCSTSSVGLLSISRNRRGKESHRLKQRRQPCGRCRNTRRIFGIQLRRIGEVGVLPLDDFAGVDAPRLPSPVIGKFRFKEQRNGRANCFARSTQKRERLRTEGVQRLLERPAWDFFSLGQGLEPVGDFVKAFAARWSWPCPDTCRYIRESRPRSRP